MFPILSLFLSSVDFLFVFEFFQEPLVHIHKPPGILPDFVFYRDASLLKSRAVSLPLVLLTAARTLNCIISWSLQPRLPSSFTFPVSPSLLVRTKFGTAPLLLCPFLIWRRQLSSLCADTDVRCLESPMRARASRGEAAPVCL